MTSPDMRQTVLPQPFAQSWTLAKTSELLEHKLSAPDFNNPTDHATAHIWRQKYQELLQPLYLAIGRHVLSLAALGKLSQAPHTEAASSQFIDAWHRAVKLEDVSDWQAMSIGRHLGKPFLSELNKAKPKFATPAGPVSTLQQIHEGLCDLAERGNFESFDTLSIQCQTSSLSLLLTMKNWQPSFERYDPQAGGFFELKAGDITAPTLEHAVIPVPSGKMLAADWFRIPEFSNLTDELVDDSVSINSSHGCALRTRQYAEKMGVAHVFVGNSSPQVIASADGVCVGWVDEDSNPVIGRSQGSVCTDLWWTTIVDKQILIELLSQKMPPEQAQDAVEKLIVEQHSTIVQFDLPPGDYQLYYTGNEEQFGPLFDRDGVDFSGLETPMFLLWKEELPLRAKTSVRMKP